MYRWPDVLRRGIGSQLIQAPHIGCIQACQAAVIVRAQRQQPSTAVGERRQRRRDAVGIVVSSRLNW